MSDLLDIMYEDLHTITKIEKVIAKSPKYERIAKLEIRLKNDKGK